VSGDGDIYPLTHVAIVLRTLRQILQIVMTVMALLRSSCVGPTLVGSPV